MISTKETSLAIAWDECFLPHPLGAFRIINHQCRRILHIYMMEMTPLHGVRHMRCRGSLLQKLTKLCYSQATDIIVYTQLHPQKKQNIMQNNEELLRKVRPRHFVGTPKVEYSYNVWLVINHNICNLML